MLRARNCDVPPVNWGPGVIPIIIPVSVMGPLPSAQVVSNSGVFAPYDFEVHGWWWGLGAFTGGTSPSWDFELMYRAAQTGTGFVADLQSLAVTTSGVGWTRLIPRVTSIRLGAAGSMIRARVTCNPGSALTSLSGYAAGLWIKPLEPAQRSIALT